MPKGLTPKRTEGRTLAMAKLVASMRLARAFSSGTKPLSLMLSAVASMLEGRGVERVQIGMRSGIVTEGTLMPESERLIGHFERLVVDALGSER